MAVGFLNEMRAVPDHRVAGMVTFPLDEILLATLVSVVCGADDWERVEDYASESLDWLRRYLPFAQGVPSAQTFRKVFRLIDPVALERGFASWAASLHTARQTEPDASPEIIAIDGKTVRGSKAAPDGTGALHLVSAYASEAGLVLAQRAVDAKSNEIIAVPQLLELLALDGAIVSIDAIGTQTEIAKAIRAKRADYVLALKGNQTSLCQDVRLFFADPGLTADLDVHLETAIGHGRIEERTARAASADWLRQRHPAWPDLTSILEITARRTDKKTGRTSSETRLYISSRAPDPALLLTAVRAHWSIENNLHWVLDVTFDEDRCRTRKDHSARGLALIRKAALNLLKREPTKLSIGRKRAKACMNPEFRAAVMAG
jgi:predicted transposase YbfD/YdcC